MSNLTSSVENLTRKSVLKAAIPILLVQLTTPLTGLIDLALIGRYYDGISLAAIALGSLVFSFVYWSFGFLRMSTTALTAQEIGKLGTQRNQLLPLFRHLIIAFFLGVSLILLQNLIIYFSFLLSDAEQDVKKIANAYIKARIWGAPAELMIYVFSGWLIGLGKTRSVLLLHCTINLFNIVFSIICVVSFKMGVKGVGFASAFAYFVGVISAYLIYKHYQKTINTKRIFQGNHLFYSLKLLFELQALKKLFMVNSGIMIRTLTLIYAFAHFVNASAKAGTEILAANQILLNYITLSAYALDAFAFLTESYVGKSYGAKNRKAFFKSVYLTTECSVFTSILAIFLILFLGGAGIEWIAKDKPEIINLAKQALPFVALISFIGVWAYQLDGIFIGATQAKTLAIAGICSLLAYLLTDYYFSNTDYYSSRFDIYIMLWSALLFFYVFRTISLLCACPNLMKQFK